MSREPDTGWPEPEQSADAGHRTIITISRQLGCGGAEVGRLVAAQMRFHYADREILYQAAQSLDLKEEELAWRDERPSSFWDRIAAAFAPGPPDVPYSPPPFRAVTAAQLYQIESRIIRELADREDCVVVGRGGAYILRDYPKATHVMLHAPEPFRIRRVMDVYQAVNQSAALAMIRDSDSARQTYHHRLGHYDWLRLENYHMSLDTSAITLEQVAGLIVQYARMRAGR